MADSHREQIVMGGAKGPSTPKNLKNSPGRNRNRPEGSRPAPKPFDASRNGIAQAREKGRERRERAASAGTVRNSKRQGKQSQQQWNHYQDPNQPNNRPNNSNSNKPSRNNGNNSKANKSKDTADEYDRYFDEVYVHIDPELGMPDSVERERANPNGDGNGLGPLAEGPEGYSESKGHDESRGHQGQGQGGMVNRLKSEVQQVSGSGNKKGQGQGKDEKSNFSVGISTEGGAISSWVRMLTEPEETKLKKSQYQHQLEQKRPGSQGHNQQGQRGKENNNSHSNGNNNANREGRSKKRAQSAGVGRRADSRGRGGKGDAGNSSHGNKTNNANDNDNDKTSANPMGPLAGQGIGGPLGQYRMQAAPVGNMLGQSSGQVGSRYIDDSGNFVHPTRRSPAEAAGVKTSVNGSNSGTSTSNRNRPQSAAQYGNETLDSDDGGHGFERDDRDGRNDREQGQNYRSQQPPKTRPHSTDGTRRPPKGKASKGPAIQVNTAYGGYEKGNLTREQGQQDRGGQSLPISVKQDNIINISKFEYSHVVGSNRPGSASHANQSQTKMKKPPSIEEFKFLPANTPGTSTAPHMGLPNGLRGGELEEYQSNFGESLDVPLTSFHESAAAQGMSSYESGGAGFEQMLLSQHSAKKKGVHTQQPYTPSARLHPQGHGENAHSNANSRRAQVEQEKARKKQEEEAIAATGYLGGLDMMKHYDGLMQLYNTENPKLTLGQKHGQQQE